MTITSSPSLGFVLVFLLFSLLFILNTYKLWFKTDAYYQDIYTSLTNTPYPFKDFFLRRLENRKRWEAEQKVFSLIGLVAVVAADVMVIAAWLNE
jgi:4-amino-4-deoxy-L-arabinose transferase-like glycosyltransferase